MSDLRQGEDFAVSNPLPEMFEKLKAEIADLKAEVERLNTRLVDVLLKNAVNETAEVRRRLLESEQIPPELREMRFK